MATEPTDIWTVTNKAGDEIARVEGATMTTAQAAAMAIPYVVEQGNRDGGFGLRRLTARELADARDQFAYEGWNLTEDEVRAALIKVFGEENGKEIADGAIPTATRADRLPHEPARDGQAGGRIIALDYYATPNLFRLRVPSHSIELVKQLTGE